MKRFFGFGVTPIVSQNGVVSVRPVGFGDSGIKVINPETGEVIDQVGMQSQVQVQATPSGDVRSTMRPDVFLSPEFIAVREVAERGINRLANTTGSGTTPPGPKEYDCGDGATFVTAAGVDEATTKCRLALLAKKTAGAGTTKYLLIGGAALVALILLKK